MSIKLNHPSIQWKTLEELEKHLYAVGFPIGSEIVMKYLIDKIKEQNAIIHGSVIQMQDYTYQALGANHEETKRKKDEEISKLKAEIESMNDALSAYIRNGDAKIQDYKYDINQLKTELKLTNEIFAASNKEKDKQIAELQSSMFQTYNSGWIDGYDKAKNF